MVVYKQFLALLLLPTQSNALLSPVSPSTGLHHRNNRPSTINASSPQFSRYDTRSSSSSSHHIRLKHDSHRNRRHPHRFAGRATTTHRALHSASSSDEIADDTNDEHDDGGGVPLSVSMGVGIVTAFIGYVYSKCMSKGFRLLWKTIPSVLFGSSSSSIGGGVGIASGSKLCNLLHRYPSAYIVLITTLGGGLVATLSTLYFPNLFNAHDYVHVLSDTKDDTKMDAFPSARSTLLPMLLMSCLTSISGFSLGPEAPMVTAGGLVGVSLARKYLRSASKSRQRRKSASSVEETLAYAGAAGTLSGFMNVPLAGPIFALEMTNRGTGISSTAARSWNSAMAACFAGMAFVRGGLVPHMGVGGHFTYGAKAAVGALTGMEMVLAGLTCGVGGAVVGTAFHKTLRFLKSAIYPSSSSSPSSTTKKPKKSTVIAKKLLVAFAIGLISVLYPQTMFWGEGTLQCVVDGQCTPLASTPHAIPAIMTTLARVDPGVPFAAAAGGGGGVTAPLQVGMAKFFAIALAAAGGFPGGVIFPLLSNGALLSHALIAAVRPLLPSATSSLVAPLMVMGFMASTLTSITRTPLATVLILALSSSGMTPLSALLPGVMMASYVSVWVSDRLSSESFFSYSE